MIRNISALAFAACIACTGATAATFDFEADADAFYGANTGSSKYEGTFDQVYSLTNVRAIAAGTNGGNKVDGITVTATATNGNDAADPFMDSDDAGLGVCSSGLQQGSVISDCSSNGGGHTGDDNLLFAELLELYFGGKRVAIDGLQIRDSGHNLINNQVDAITINNKVFGTDSNGQVNLAGLMAADTYTFTSAASGKEIYLSVLEVSQVPLPAAGFLLLGALGGLGAVARRRKT